LYARAQTELMCYLGCSGTMAGFDVGWISLSPREAPLCTIATLTSGSSLSNNDYS